MMAFTGKGRPYGIAPAVPSLTGGSIILQGAGGSPYQMFKFPAPGRIWVAGVSFAMTTAAGGGATQGYAQVQIAPGAAFPSGFTLAICECAVDSPAAGTPSSDSNVDPAGYPGMPVPSGTIVRLDVNGGVVVAGVTVRGSGRVAVSIP